MKSQKSKVKSQNYVLKFKNFMAKPQALLTSWIVILMFAFCILNLAPRVLSQSPTPEEEEISPEIKEKVQERIEAIQESTNRKAGFFGTIADVSNSTLTIESEKGERKIKTDEETDFLGAKGQAIELDDLEIEDFIIALGYLESDGYLLGKRISVLAEEPEPVEPKEAAYGEVADISQEEEVISLSSLKDDATYEIDVTSKTTIETKVGEKIKEIDFDEIEIGDRLAAVGTKENGNGTISASVIYLIPSQTEEEITPTPKASPTPTEEE
jgi:hypothetical protein